VPESVVIIANKFPNKCRGCGNKVPIGKGFAIFDKRASVEDRKWVTQCVGCFKRDEYPEDKEDQPLPF
jgi:hypothetical protein